MTTKQPIKIFSRLSFWSVAIGSMAILAACGGDSGSKSSGAEDVPVREVSTIYDLGACTPDREGDTVYVTAQAIDYLCSNNNWIDITTLSENPDVNLSSGGVSGNDPESSSSNVDDPLNGSSSSSVRASYIEVSTKEQLGTCDSSAIGLRALVLADSSYFICKVGGWAKDEAFLGYDIVPTKEDLPLCHAGSAKQRVLVKKDSIFFRCDSVKWVPETADGYIVRNASILGAAQKGPFKFGSPLTLREVLLHDDALTYTGREYIDEISSNKGDFVIPKVNLVYPYAVLEVRGLWRNEVTGEWSKDSMTLRALTDLTSRTEVNINLLTHLEYDRAVQLVNKGYSMFAAKKQAEYEIMTAFGFATTVEYSEDLKTFVPSTSENYGENATLMAISLLFIGDRSEAEIQKAIADFKQDMAGDGEWNDAQTKADMADWAESFDDGSVRANVKSWNILDIPAYENYLTIYWNNAYELGGCASTRYDVVAQNRNAKSKNHNVHYICKATGWRKATDYEKDTYQWAEGEEGEFKKGDVTETYYVFENGSWIVAKNETALGLCTEARNGEIGKIDTTYFICDSKNWRKATVLEYDTYQFGAGNDGEVRTGKVNENKYYVYENGVWRASASEIENNLGACVASRLNEVGKSGNTYYTCKTSGWTKSTALEYDTYGWEPGTEGAVKPGSVNTSNHYVFENGAWRASKNDVEYNYGACVTIREGEKHPLNSKYYICENKAWKEITATEYGLGYCTTAKNGAVEKLNDVYYICKTNSWKTATVLEYDTYGMTCSTDGAIVGGRIIPTNKYVCDAGAFRVANEQEKKLNKGCVNYTENEKLSLNGIYYICENKAWKEITAIEYGLGYCTTAKNGIVEKLNDVYYICKSEKWNVATVLEYDTYGKTCSTDGAIVGGRITPTNKYVCDAGAFRVANEQEKKLNKGCVNYTENEKLSLNGIYYICESKIWKEISATEYGLGYCTTAKNGTVEKLNDVYYICKSEKWNVATALEYDTYGWTAGTDGEIKAGSVNANNYYIYKDSKWQETSIGTDLGICNSDKDGFVGVSGGVYYICKTNSWNVATVLEYDTYGWTAGTEGEVKAGNVNTSNYYIYIGSEWQTASSVEKNLGGCTTAREGEVDKSEDTYYICKSKTWKTATIREYDTYGKICLTDGSIVPGEVTPPTINKYVCDADTFRTANYQEKSLNKGCVSYTEGNEIRKQLSSVTDSVYLCNNGLWEERIEFAREYGTLTDERDGKTYKTVTIGTQTWMAENLNYSDSVSYPSMKGQNWCYNSLDSCTKYGRLYTWAAAMDSVGTFSTNGKGCGDGKTCSPTYPVRGICPSGWHLPQKSEWATLITAVGGESTAGKMLKSASGWKSNGNGTDAFGFSALPAGYYSTIGGSFLDVGRFAHFWSATDYNRDAAYEFYLQISYSSAKSKSTNKSYNGFSIRCVKD